MKISPDAIALSIIWAKKYHPWLWDFKANRWNQTSFAQRKSFLTSNQDQIQYALLNGWSPDSIKEALKTNKDKKLSHVYQILNKSEMTSEDIENYMTSSDLYHKALFNGIISKASFGLDDLMKYQEPLFSITDQNRWTLKVLVNEKGIDIILFAIDLAKDSSMVLNSPWGLKNFFEEAELNRKARKAKLTGLAIESNAMRGNY